MPQGTGTQAMTTKPRRAVGTSRQVQIDFCRTGRESTELRLHDRRNPSLNVCRRGNLCDRLGSAHGSHQRGWCTGEVYAQQCSAGMTKHQTFTRPSKTPCIAAPRHWRTGDDNKASSSCGFEQSWMRPNRAAERCQPYRRPLQIAEADAAHPSQLERRHHSRHHHNGNYQNGPRRQPTCAEDKQRSCIHFS